LPKPSKILKTFDCGARKEVLIAQERKKGSNLNNFIFSLLSSNDPIFKFENVKIILKNPEILFSRKTL